MKEEFIPGSVCVMTPVYGAVHWRFFESMGNLLSLGLKDRRVIFKGIYGDSLVSRARNIATALFLEPGDKVGRESESVLPRCEWLMFIDSDISFKLEDIEMLLDARKPLIGGLYSKKSLGGHWVINTMSSGDLPPIDGGPFKVRYMGTGFLLIHRTIFDKMIAAYPEIAYVDDNDMTHLNWHNQRWDLWPVGIKTYTNPEGERVTRYLSEDWYFCERAQELGIDVWCHADVQLTHYGEIGFPITPFVEGCDMQEIVKIMKQSVDRGELETAEELQTVLETALDHQKKLGPKETELTQESPETPKLVVV